MEGIVHYELLERNLSLLNAVINNFAIWRKQSSKNARVDDMECDSSTRQRPTTHCEYDESGHSGTRLGDSSTSTLFSGPFPIGLPLSSALSPTTCEEFPTTTTLGSKIGSTTSSRPNRRISSSAGSKTCPNVGRQP
jgi:hypothetical protein